MVLRAAGCTAPALYSEGFCGDDLKAAGYTLLELKQVQRGSRTPQSPGAVRAACRSGG